MEDTRCGNWRGRLIPLVDISLMGLDIYDIMKQGREAQEKLYKSHERCRQNKEDFGRLLRASE
jgi:hypothetical protein